MEEDKTSYHPLNKANMKLAMLCRDLITTVKHANPSLPVIASLESLYDQWISLHQTVGPYDSFRLAAAISSELSLAGIDLSREVIAHTEILDAFINVPSVIKTFFQFNIVLNEESVISDLADIVTWLKADPDLSAPLRELTIYSEPIYQEGLNVGQRLARLKFNPSLITTKNDSVIEECSSWLATRFADSRIVPAEHLTMYAARLSPNVFVAQGNSNYKRFLHLLGILDRAYDRTTNFAFCTSVKLVDS